MEHTYDVTTINIKVKKYARNGKHVCIGSFFVGEYCKFLGVRQFGQQYLCMFNGEDLFNNSDGNLQPCKNCPLHRKTDK